MTLRDFWPWRRRRDQRSLATDTLVERLLSDAIKEEARNSLVQELLNLGDGIYQEIELQESDDPSNSRRLGDLRRVLESVEALTDAADDDTAPERRRRLVANLGTTLETLAAGDAARRAEARETALAAMRRLKAASSRRR